MNFEQRKALKTWVTKFVDLRVNSPNPVDFVCPTVDEVLLAWDNFVGTLIDKPDESRIKRDAPPDLLRLWDKKVAADRIAEALMAKPFCLRLALRYKQKAVSTEHEFWALARKVYPEFGVNQMYFNRSLKILSNYDYDLDEENK